MPSIAKPDDFYGGLRQEWLNWCIPTGLALLTHHVGIEIPIDRLVVEYSRQNGDGALLLPIPNAPPNTVLSVDVAGLTDAQILNLAKHASFGKGNFDTFSHALSSIVDLPAAGFSLHHPQLPSDNGSLQGILENSIAGEFPALFVGINPDGTHHVYLAVAVNANEVRAYEPWEGQFQNKSLDDYFPNRDCLLIQPI
jgi:hypothetical protein